MPPRKRTKSKSQDDISVYIPSSVAPFVHPYEGDFCYSFSFHPKLIALLMANGFLPIATEQDGMFVLLPKLHRERCVIRLCTMAADISNPQPLLSTHLHISKSARKKSRRFDLTVNEAFDDVLQGCRQQHGLTCWLYEPLVDAFRTLFESSLGVAVPLATAVVRVWSVEVWDEQGTLAAGELGYTVGKVYTSLTGFTRQDSAGSVQLAALGSLLTQQGFELWDLGMAMRYKESLGSELMARDDFCDVFRRVRGQLLELPTDRVNCRSLIDDARDKNRPNGVDGTSRLQKDTKKKKPNNFHE